MCVCDVSRMRLNFCGTELSPIANLLNIHKLYFGGCWEWIDMVDHLVSGELLNYLISNKVSSVFALPIQYKGGNRAQGTVRCPFFYHFVTLARNIRGLNYLQMVFWTAKNTKVSCRKNLSAYSTMCILQFGKIYVVGNKVGLHTVVSFTQDTGHSKVLPGSPITQTQL